MKKIVIVVLICSLGNVCVGQQAQARKSLRVSFSDASHLHKIPVTEKEQPLSAINVFEQSFDGVRGRLDAMSGALRILLEKFDQSMARQEKLEQEMEGLNRKMKKILATQLMLQITYREINQTIGEKNAEPVQLQHNQPQAPTQAKPVQQRPVRIKRSQSDPERNNPQISAAVAAMPRRQSAPLVWR
jgi:chromosome segregation ATPase